MQYKAHSANERDILISYNTLAGSPVRMETSFLLAGGWGLMQLPRIRLRTLLNGHHPNAAVTGTRTQAYPNACCNWE